ncbi:MAG TPA: ABC transporter permease [Fibrobacteraceae bacterium]|jgi:phospholipid/cholesterol/gamma-HCH transport system permease protein|nr:ABC transporter permease [Fibrobacter sp.]HOG67959.1 ABC transporter permease [Fibrobacteraceae bacterium]HPW93619.1 ABC transporter permease [Fibrobacteraceae bacterium]
MKNYVVYKKLTLPGRFFCWLGVVFLSTTFGQQFTLFIKTVASIFSRNRNFKTDSKNIINQIFFTGIEIFPVLFVVATLFGTVIIIEVITMMNKVGFSDVVGNLMVIVIIRELGPIFTAFLIAGRSGSALTTYIGSMAINSEVDSLATMGVDPIRYLVMPALIGGIFAVLIMTILFSFSGICAGFLTAKVLIYFAGDMLNVQISWSYLSTAILQSLTITDFILVIVKPVLFACIIITNASYQGLAIRKDVRQVPKATSRSVIYSFLYIVVFDVILSFFYIFQYFGEISKII